MSYLKEWDNQIAIIAPVSPNSGYTELEKTGVSSRRRVGAVECEIFRTKDAVVPTTELNKVLNHVSELYDTVGILRQGKYEQRIILTPVTKKAVNLIIEEYFPEDVKHYYVSSFMLLAQKKLKRLCQSMSLYHE